MNNPLTSNGYELRQLSFAAFYSPRPFSSRVSGVFSWSERENSLSKWISLFSTGLPYEKVCIKHPSYSLMGSEW